MSKRFRENSDFQDLKSLRTFFLFRISLCKDLELMLCVSRTVSYNVGITLTGIHRPGHFWAFARFSLPCGGAFDLSFAWEWGFRKMS